MQPWLDLLMKYGWQPLLAVGIVLFVYKELWPWLKKRADDREVERRERESLLHSQIDKLTIALESTGKAVIEAAHVSERLVDKVEAINSEVKSNGKKLDHLGEKMDQLGAGFESIRMIWIKKRDAT